MFLSDCRKARIYCLLVFSSTWLAVIRIVLPIERRLVCLSLPLLNYLRLNRLIALLVNLRGVQKT